MNNKRILSIILVAVMLFGTITTSFGEVGGVGKIDLSKIAEFEDLRKAISTGGNTAFTSNEDAKYFRGSFYDTVFPEKSINGKDMAFGNVLNKGIFYYGNAGLIPTDSSVANHLRQKKDSKGNVLYLGWTQDGRQVPNIDYQESQMSNITVVDPKPYMQDLTKPYSGNVRPFKTDYTDPIKVGAMFAPNAKPSEQEVYGKKLINEWAKKTMLRPTGWKPKGVSSGAFTQFYTVDEYMKYVTVTIPPTSKTYGQAVVFFNNNGSQTRRTFMIAPLDDVDYIAVNMAPETEWNEETKTLTVGYKVTGMDPIQWGNMDHWLMSNYDIPEENLKVENIDAYNHTGLGTGNVAFSSKNVRKGSPGLYGIANLKVMDYSLHIMENIESQSTAIREVTYDFSELLADERAESINLNYIVALGVDEYATKENNKINVTIPATAGYDFKVTVPSPEIQASGDTTDIVVNAELVSLNIKDGEEIVTDLTLHDNTGKVLDKQTGIKFTKSKLKQELKFTINSKDIVDEKDYYVVINADKGLTKSFPEEREKKDKLKDNKVEIKVKKASADFEIKAETSYKSKEKDGKNVDVKFKVALSNTSETISTTVVLYKGSTSIGTQNLTFTGGGEQTVTFSVPEGSLGLGDSTLTAIVNADRGLTKASPYTLEKELKNNKVEMTVSISDTIVGLPNECKFDGTGGTDRYKLKNKYIRKTCRGRNSDGSSYSYDCSYYVCDDHFTTYDLVRKSDVSYMDPKSQNTTGSKNGIFSDNWHKNLEGQKFSDGKNLPNGRNLKGEAAKDDLMSAVGRNPLKQVIQAGAGIQVKTKIRVKGTAEEFNKYISHSTIKGYANSFKTGAMYVSGKDVSGVTKNVRNNAGKFTQKMSYDASRSSELKEVIRDVGSRKYGVAECAPIIEVFKTEFEFEIPVIIDTAVGNINVINGKSVKVPNEKKWFVYLNEHNDKYGLRVVSTIDPSLLGASNPKTDCVLNHNDFKFGVYGTIFDNVNTGNESNSDTPFWDN